ncbi:ribosome silencing factor [Inquilinus limosus]|uniref:ribosome silencing factor n=1 Tax=Inquilinus limosus TaxID=171674 RepID=UPI00269018F6
MPPHNHEVNAIRPNTETPLAEAGRLPPGLAASLARPLLETALTSLDDDKAEDMVVIDLTGRSSIADSLIIATGRSSRQVAAMADHLLEKLKPLAPGPVQVEGQQRGDWVLIDAGDVVVHLFRPEVREFYALEKMWDDDAERVTRIGTA